MPSASTTKSFIWSFLEQAGSRLIAMVVEIILARLLVPEMFGVMAILLVLVNVADVVAQSGLGVALIQRQDTTALSYTTGFWMSECIALVLYGIIFFSAPLLANFYQMDELIPLLRVLALVLFFKAFNSIQRSFLQKEMRFRALFISNTIAVTVAGLIGIALAFFGFGVWALVAQSLAQGAFTCLVMFIQVPWKPTLIFSIEEAKRLFGYGWKICVSGIFGKLYTGLSDLIIGKACDATQLGYYSNGAKWPKAGMTAFSNALENVFFPVFSSISSDSEALKRALMKAVSVGTYVMVFVSFLLIVIAEPLIELLLTDKWLPSTLVFQLVCLTFAFSMVQIANLRAYMALGDSGLYMKLQIIKVILGMCLITLVAVLTANIYWVAATDTIVTVLSIIAIDLQPAKRMVGIGRWAQVKAVIPTFVLGVCAAALAYPIVIVDLPLIATILLQTAVYGFVYVGASKLAKMNGYIGCVAALKTLKRGRGRD